MKKTKSHLNKIKKLDQKDSFRVLLQNSTQKPRVGSHQKAQNLITRRKKKGQNPKFKFWTQEF